MSKTLRLLTLVKFLVCHVLPSVSHQVLICHDLFRSQASQQFLECARCGTVVHPACLSPPLAENADCEWHCIGCGEKTSDYQGERRRYLSVVSARLFLLPLPY